MKKLRWAAAAVGIGGLVVLAAACGEPSGQVSPSGDTWNVTFTKDFQNSVGYPIVSAKAVCNGEGFWRESTRWNVNSVQAPTLTLAVYCASGIAVGSWGEYTS